jgi:hypothetical protein
VKAEDVYVDPSGLARLYIHQAGSREMSVWRRRISGTLAVTHHGRTEIINAICRDVFLGHLMAGAGREAIGD